MANVAPDQWAELDRIGRAGDFKRALAMQEMLRPLSDLIFGEPIVEAVARIKTILKNERLIAHDMVRPPQMGIQRGRESRTPQALCSAACCDRKGRIVQREKRELNWTRDGQHHEHHRR